MFTDVSICNMALGHVGTAGNIDSLDQDSSNARVCKQFYPVAKDKILRSYEWDFARTEEALVYLGPLNRDVHQYNHRYQYPPNCVKFLRINSDLRLDTRESAIAYARFGQEIYTDRQDAVARWIYPAIEGHFESDFALSLSYLVAFYISPSVSRGNNVKKPEEFYAIYEVLASQASASSANEYQPDPFPESSFVRARS